MIDSNTKQQSDVIVVMMLLHSTICVVQYTCIRTFSYWNKNFPTLVDGGYSAWTDWSADTCTATCGTGTQTRIRLCNDPAPANGGLACIGADSEARDCNTDACPGNLANIKFDSKKNTFLQTSWWKCLCTVLIKL